MRRDITIPSANYTATGFHHEELFQPGKYTLKRILAGITGNAANVTIAVYVAAQGLTWTTLTNAIKATSEVYFNNAIAAAADPVPELNVVGDPIQMDVRSSESVYVQYIAGDTPTNGTIRLFL